MNWALWGPIMGGVLATAGVWALFIKVGTPNFRKFVFELITDEKDGQPLLRAAIEKCFEQELESSRTVADATDDLLGRMDAAELAIKAKANEHRRLSDAVQQIPELNRILNEIKLGNESFGRKFESAMEKFTTELAHVREGVARMEGKWDGIERRNHP